MKFSMIFTQGYLTDLCNLYSFSKLIILSALVAVWFNYEVQAGPGTNEPIQSGRAFTQNANNTTLATCQDLNCILGFKPSSDTVPHEKYWKRTKGSNSQVDPFRKILFGDFDGDRQADYLQYSDYRIFITRASFRGPEIAHIFFTEKIDRIFTGDFYGAGHDQLCVRIKETIKCYGMNGPNDDQFRFWFQQGVYMDPNEEIIVGDYDGDDKDELFLYNYKTGDMRMMKLTSKTAFIMSDWRPGNLSMVDDPYVHFRVGDWDGDNKDDLIAINRNNQILVFRSVISGGKLTHWWSFTTVSNFIKDDESLQMARIDNDLKEEFVIHNETTGEVTFRRVRYDGGRPAKIGIPEGQIKIRKNSQLVMAYSHKQRGEVGSEYRDDAFVYDKGNRRIYKSEARWSNSEKQYTYWWDYTHFGPNNHYGWPEPVRKKVIFLKCKFSDKDVLPYDNEFYSDLTDRIINYFGEVTYGGLDLTSSKLVQKWQNLGQTDASFNKSRRQSITNKCMEVAGEDKGDYDAIVALINNNASGGASGNRALLGDRGLDVWVSVQEIAHALGDVDDVWQKHPRDEVGKNYANPWDPMSARTNGFTYRNNLGKKEGPGMTAFTRTVLPFVPDQRIKTVNPSNNFKTYRISALNRPGSKQYLELRVRSSSGVYYSLEYRERVGFDRGIPHNTVLIHQIKSNNTWLQLSETDGTIDKWETAERLQGERFIKDDIEFHIQKIDFDNHMATVRVRRAP